MSHSKSRANGSDGAAARRPDMSVGGTSSPLPLYHRIYVILRERILSGIHTAGDILPSEAELMERYSVSRITARRALDELAGEGLVTRRRGRGTEVSSRAIPSLGDAPIVGDMEGLMANLSVIGRQTSVTLFEFDFVPAPEMIAKELGVEPGVQVLRAVRGRSADDRPFSLSTAYIIPAIGQRFSRHDLTSSSLIDLVVNSGTRIGHVEQRFTATLADDVMAQRLNVLVASPLLRMCRSFFDTQGRCCYYIDVVYPPSRFEFRMRIPR